MIPKVKAGEMEAQRGDGFLPRSHSWALPSRAAWHHRHLPAFFPERFPSYLLLRTRNYMPAN